MSYLRNEYEGKQSIGVYTFGTHNIISVLILFLMNDLRNAGSYTLCLMYTKERVDPNPIVVCGKTLIA